MALEIHQIKEIRKKARNKDLISKMTRYEDRMRFHTDVAIDENGVNVALSDFKKFVNSILPDDKYETFMSLLRFPIDTVRLTDETYQALEKVFDGRDPVFQYDFLNEETKNDWMEYRNKVLQYSTFWKSQGFDTMKKSIHSVMVVDLPTEQTTTRPAPYMFFLDIRNVIDFEKKDDTIEWIMFHLPNDMVAVYDDKYYRTFTKRQWENGTNLMEPVVEATHELGYCPAKFFWNGMSPISTQLAQLDWILFFSVSKKYSDLFSPYTIYWGYQQDCEFEIKDSGHHCDGGFLKGKNEEHLYTKERKLVPCPKCSNRIAGVGSFVDVPVPDSDEADPLAPPVGKVDVDVSSLDYNVKEVKRLEENFYSSVTGNSLEAINDQAINTKQVMSLFESRKQALVNLKKFFEKAQQWTESTICRLRYGNSFVSSYVNYGTEFYLFTPEVILEMYTAARKEKLDHITLDILQDHFYETKYRNNPMKLNRSKILINIEPLRHSTIEEVKKMYDDNHLSFEEYFMKANFSSFILRFERENGDIGEFLKGIPFAEKVNIIESMMMNYVEIPKGKESKDLRETIMSYKQAVDSGGIKPQQSDEVYFRKSLGIPEMGK